MKTLLYTGHDDAYAPLAAITVPRMHDYAHKHGMDFMLHLKPIIDVPNGIYWTGVCGALKSFSEGYDAAMYLDVDQLITNFNPVWPPMAGGFHVSKDWGEDATDPFQFSACGFIAYKQDCVGLFRHILALEPEWRDKPFPEQGPMQYAAKRFSDNVHIHPRKVFNCVPDQVCPGKVPEPWTKGDWCAHLTMVDLPRRIEIAKEILDSL